MFDEKTWLWTCHSGVYLQACDVGQTRYSVANHSLKNKWTDHREWLIKEGNSIFISANLYFISANLYSNQCKTLHAVQAYRGCSVNTELE